MTLERHRSRLIPAVDFGGDGQLFVTDRQGTFPLRSDEKSREIKSSKDIDWSGGKKPSTDDRKRKGTDKNHQSKDGNWGRKGKEQISKEDLDLWDKNKQNKAWEYDRYGSRHVGETGSYHSYDPKRESRKYKPKEMTNYEKVMKEISGTGTVSSRSSNSLSRKVRRSKSNRYYSDERRHGSQESVATASDTGRRFRRGGTPRMTPEAAAYEDFRRNNSKYRSLDVNALRKHQREMNNNKPYSTYDTYSKRNGYGDMNGYGINPHDKDKFDNYVPFVKKISEEKLPFVLFIALGVLLLVLGVGRLLLTYWHEYFCLLWSGVAMLMFGLLGAVHSAQYLNLGKTLGYILLAALNACTTMATTGLILPVLVPCLRHIVNGDNLGVVITNVQFSNWNMTLIPTSSWMSNEVTVYLSLCIDIAGLLVAAAGFASLTVMLIALDYYWEANHDRTGECDHKGNPRFFNPLEQMSMAQATIFIGLLTINLQMPEVNTYYSPVAAPFVLVLAGFSAIWFGKRPDLHGIGLFSTLLEVIAMLLCGVATVLVTLGMVDSVTTLLSDSLIVDYKKSEVITSAVAASIFILIMIVNIVFAVGIVFRNVKQICCSECFDDYLDQPYVKSEHGSDTYSVRM